MGGNGRFTEMIGFTWTMPEYPQFKATFKLDEITTQRQIRAKSAISLAVVSESADSDYTEIHNHQTRHPSQRVPMKLKSAAMIAQRQQQRAVVRAIRMARETEDISQVPSDSEFMSRGL